MRGGLGRRLPEKKKKIKLMADSQSWPSIGRTTPQPKRESLANFWELFFQLPQKTHGFASKQPRKFKKLKVSWILLVINATCISDSE
jgi:hypothetical protein